MGSAEAALFGATLAGSVASLLVAALRGPARRAFGACTAYRLWLLVPAAVLATLLPGWDDPVARAPSALQVFASPARWLPASGTAEPAAGQPWIELWLAGVVALALLLALQQWRFTRRLGPHSMAADGIGRGLSSGPVVVGAWRPRIVLPMDFESRYDAEERALVLAHEQAHLRREDARVNAVAASLLCVFWFNPIAFMALGWFRFDQELACDAEVLRRAPGARRTYANAMLKTQIASDAQVWRQLPLGCHWRPAHPLNVRIAMLKHPLPGRTRRLAGIFLLVSLGLGCSYLAWAAQLLPMERTDVRATVLRLAAAEGMAVETPELLPECAWIAPDYRKVRARAAIVFLANAVGLVPVERGHRIRFAPPDGTGLAPGIGPGTGESVAKECSVSSAP